MEQTTNDEVLAPRLRFSSEREHSKRCVRKRKRKCVSVPELPKEEQVEQQYNCHTVTEEKRTVVSKVVRIDQLPLIDIMLHHRGLWTRAVMVNIR